MNFKLDGVKYAEQRRALLKKQIVVYDTKPCLAIVQVNHDFGSDVYVRNKMKDADEVGIDVRHIYMENPTEVAALQAVKELATNDEVDAIMVQLPLPDYINTRRILDAIPPEKDADGFTAVNAGYLYQGRLPLVYPCTANGAIQLLEHRFLNVIRGTSALVIGRSNIVGKPIAQMLQNKGATVTVAHSCTPPEYLKHMLDNVMIVVSATGDRYILKDVDIKPGRILIDVGMNRDENGKLCGDMPARWYEDAFAYTPVPGGVGPMTRLMLMENTFALYERKMKNDLLYF